MNLRLITRLALTLLSTPLLAKPIEFNQALALVEERSLPLKAAEAEIQTQLATAWQAGLLPNPLLSADIDDFGGSGYYNSFKHADYSVSLTQPFDLSGKRSARQNVALAAVCVSFWNYQKLRQQIHKDIEEAFVVAVASQEYTKLMEEQFRIAQDCLSSIKEKVAQGKAPPFQEKGAAITCRSSKLAFERAKSNERGAIKAIATLLSTPCADFDEVVYPLYTIAPLVPENMYEARLDNNAELVTARMGVYAAAETHKLEVANRIPDLDITATVSNDDDDNKTSFGIGFSIPLPIFDRNQGNICRSSWQTVQANYMQQDVEINLRNRLAIAYQHLAQAREAAITMQQEIQQCAEEALGAAQEEHRHGKIELPEVLEAQRACNEIRVQFIDALKEYHQRRIEIENIAPPDGA